MDNRDEHTEIIPGEQQDVTADEVQDLVPEMPAPPPVVQSEGTDSLVSDDDMKDSLQEIKDLMMEDREQIKALTEQVADMVVNGGDASPSSKEMLSSLLKTQTDLIDKLAKVADLKARLKMKEKNTMPGWMLKQQQTNNFNIQGGKKTSRLLIDAIHQHMKPKTGDNDAK